MQALGRNRRGGLIWPVAGGAPDDGEGGGGGAGGEGEGGGSGGEGGEGEKKVTLTQAEYDRQMSERANKAERAARKKLLEEFGLPEGAKPEDVKTQLAAAETARLAALSEGDRVKEEARLAKEQAEAERTAAAQERDAAKKERHETRVQQLLERAGVGVGEEYDKDPAKRDRAVARAAHALEVDVEVGADSDDIRKAIETLKKDSPGLFGTGGRREPGDGRVQGTQPGFRSKGQSVKEAGHEAAKKYFGVSDKQAS